MIKIKKKIPRTQNVETRQMISEKRDFAPKLAEFRLPVLHLFFILYLKNVLLFEGSF